MSSWSILSKPFFIEDYHLLSTPYQVNEHEYITISSIINPDNKNTMICGIHKYLLAQNKWSEICTFPINHTLCKIHSVYSKQKNIIFIFAPTGFLFSFNVKNKTVTKLEQYQQYYLPNLLMNGNNIHIVGGIDNNKHIILDTSFKNGTKTSIIHFFKTKLIGHLTIQLHIKQKFLLFSENHRNVLEYYLNDNNWSLNKKLPIPTNLKFGAIISDKHEKYIIILGGRCNQPNLQNKETDTITVYNLLTNQMAISGIKCPLKGNFQAVLVNKEFGSWIYSQMFQKETFYESTTTSFIFNKSNRTMGLQCRNSSTTFFM